MLGASALVGAEGAFAVGVLEGAAATQRSTIADVADLTIHTDFEAVRVFAADRQDVEVELSVSARMSRRAAPGRRRSDVAAGPEPKLTLWPSS